MTSIYINPGHGIGRTGKPDPGAVGPSGLTESSVAQELAKRVGNLLRAKGYATHGTVESLTSATRRANELDVDFFLSLHCNASTEPTAGGFEVLYQSDEGKHAAQQVLWQVIPQVIQGKGKWIHHHIDLRNRGIVHRADLHVLNATHMPAILVECAFISNPREEKLLQDHLFLEAMAQAISDGVHAYLTHRK